MSKVDKSLWIGVEIKDFRFVSMLLTNIEYLLPSDVKKMQEGNWDLSIFTCSYDNQKRITYRFELVN